MALSKTNKYLIIIGLIFCIALACISPFIASGDPDGLEKSAEDSSVSEDTAYEAISSPMPDYSYEPLGKIGEIGALILGAIIVLVLGFGVGKLLKKKE